MQRILSSRLTTVALIGLVTALTVHVLAQNTASWRADLTADNLYSLSEGTELILERMQQEGVKPIEVKLYFSETTGKSLPRFIKDFVVYHKYIEALLEEYEVAGQGKIEVSSIDPLPDSDDAQDALDAHEHEQPDDEALDPRTPVGDEHGDRQHEGRQPDERAEQAVGVLVVDPAGHA